MARKIDTSSFNEAAVVELMGVMPARRAAPAAASTAITQVQVPAAEAIQPNAASAAVPAAPPAPAPAERIPAVAAAQASVDACVKADTDAAEKTAPVKRKEQDKSYDDIFMRNTPIRLRTGVALEVDVLDKLNYIARVALNDKIPVSVLVNNIILHHIEEYKDEFVRRMEENKSAGDFLYSK